MKKLLLVISIVFLFGFTPVEKVELPLHLDWGIYTAQPYSRFDKSEWDMLTDNEKRDVFFQVAYVTTTGSGTTCSQGSPCSLTYAFSNAVAGDDWHVKAGNYGNGTFSQSNDGNSGNRIRFIGYKTTPGDISVAANSHSAFTYGDTVDSAEMPYVIGTNQASDNFLYINGDYVTIENFQSENYNRMVQPNGDHNIIKNCIAVDLGDQSINTGSTFGKAFTLAGDFNELVSSYVENAGGEGVVITGNNNEVSYTKVYNDNSVNNTDYYISVNSPSDVTHGNDNEIHHCEIYNLHSGSHNGHGFDVKGARDNHFHDNYSYRTYAAEINFANSTGNLFEDHISDSEDVGGQLNEGGIWLFNGADGNEIRNFLMRNVNNAVSFRNYDDGAVSDPLIDVDYGGINNLLVNIVGTNVGKAVNFGEGSLPAPAADSYTGNTLRNCSFDGGRVDIYLNVTHNTTFENCSFSGAPQAAFIGSTALDPTDVIDYCNFFNNTYSTPSGSNYTNITAIDPEFTDLVNDDMSLLATSGIRNIGKTISGQTTDINGDSYVNGPPIGAYEYGGTQQPNTGSQTDPFFGFFRTN